MPKFNPNTHTVTGVNGGDINIRDDTTGKEYRRNIIHLKKIEDGEWTIVDKSRNDDLY